MQVEAVRRIGIQEGKGVALGLPAGAGTAFRGVGASFDNHSVAFEAQGRETLASSGDLALADSSITKRCEALPPLFKQEAEGGRRSAPLWPSRLRRSLIGCSYAVMHEDDALVSFWLRRVST